MMGQVITEASSHVREIWDRCGLLIDEFYKFLQSIICCNPAIQGLCKLFNFGFKTARLLCKMIQKILNILW